MKDKQLKDRAIKFKGKDYVLVADRVNYFNDEYPLGGITTKLTIEGDMMIMKATIYPDMVNTPTRKFCGYSQASYNDTTSFVNKTSAIENAETSAVGRALAFMGIGVIDSIASVDEMHKVGIVEDMKSFSYKPTTAPQNMVQKDYPASQAQIDRIGLLGGDVTPNMTVREATALICKLQENER